MAEKQETLLTYKGKPLVRSGNVLYYGDMAEKCVVMLQILSTKTKGDMQVADRVQVQLLLTDPEVRMKDRILKKSEKNRFIQCYGHRQHLVGTHFGRKITKTKEPDLVLPNRVLFHIVSEVNPTALHRLAKPIPVYLPMLPK